TSAWWSRQRRAVSSENANFFISELVHCRVLFQRAGEEFHTLKRLRHRRVGGGLLLQKREQLWTDADGRIEDRVGSGRVRTQVDQILGAVVRRERFADLHRGIFLL